MYRVLVVDDITIIRSSIARQVDESPCRVKTAGVAENGVSALDWLEINYADICITDIKMPVMDGFELIARLKEKYPWMVCLIVSSYDDFNYARQSIQLETVDYVLKPVEQQNLDEALQKSVDRLNKQRLDLATSVLLAHLSEWSSLTNPWKEALKIGHGENERLLESTVSMLSHVSGQKDYLLEQLAIAWIRLFLTEMKIPNANEWQDPLLEEKTEEIATQTDFSAACKGILRKGMVHAEKLYFDSKEVVQNKLMDKLIQYIGENYRKSDISLQELADEIAVSKNHLSKIFKQEMGVTVWSYIIGLRMEEAKKMLAQSYKKSFEIAQEVGYSDYIHFSRLFKEVCGVSPQEYRKRLQGHTG